MTQRSPPKRPPYKQAHNWRFEIGIWPFTLHNRIKQTERDMTAMREKLKRIEDHHNRLIEAFQISIRLGTALSERIAEIDKQLKSFTQVY